MKEETTALQNFIADAKTKSRNVAEQLLVEWCKKPEHRIETGNLPDILSLVHDKDSQLQILIKWSGQPNSTLELAALQKILPLAGDDGQKLMIQQWLQHPEHHFDIDFVNGVLPFVSDKNKLDGLQKWCEDPDNSVDLDTARYLLDLSGFEPSERSYGLLQRVIIKRLAEKNSSPLAHIPLENRLLAGTMMLEGKIPAYALTNPDALIKAIFNSYDALLLLDSGETTFGDLTKLGVNEVDNFASKAMGAYIGEEVYGAAKEVDFNTTYGVEIECCAKKFEKYHPFSWNRTTDESVKPNYSGEETAEYVSSILNKNNIQGLGVMGGQLAKGEAYANLSCGLHIHAGMLPFANAEMGNETLNLIKQIVVNYTVLENEGLGFPKRRWQVDDYKEVLGEKHTLQDVINAPTIEEMIQITQPRGYAGAKVNLLALFKHGTIEFREASGTVNTKDILSWMKFVDTLVGQSMAMVQSTDVPHIPNETELSVLQSAMVVLKAHNACVNGSTLGGENVLRVEKMGGYLMSAASADAFPPLQTAILAGAISDIFENQLDISFNAIGSSRFLLTQAIEKHFSNMPDPFNAFLDAFEKQSTIRFEEQRNDFVNQGASPEMADMFIGSPEQFKTLFSSLRAEMEKYAPKITESQPSKQENFLQEIIKKGPKLPLEEKTSEPKGPMGR